MTAIRPPLYDAKKLIDELVLTTGLAWEVCRHTPQVVSTSRCGRFTYSIETEQIDRFTALVELTPLVQKGTLAECWNAINRHQAERSK